MLSGVTILDLTQFLAGPFATQILGDLGANIIKIEWGEGDSTRSLPPYFVGEDSLYFLSTNRNKRSMCLNLKSQEGREIFLRMVSQADVVIENFRMIVQALSGGMSMTGEVGGKPVRTGQPNGDLDAGLYAVIGILAELYRRSQEKEDSKLKHIDIAMLDCQVAKLSY